MRKAVTYIISAFVLAIFFGGCTRRDLETRPDDGILQINLHWGAYASNHPATSQYVLYNATTGDVITLTSDDRGWYGHVPAGMYEIIATNGESGMVGVDLMDQISYTEDIAMAKDDYAWAPNYIKNVKTVFSSGVAGVEVRRTHLVKVVDMDMHNLVRRLSVIVNTNGYTNIDDLYVSVGGIVIGRTLHNQALHADVANVNSKVEKHPTLLNRYDGEITFFGVRGQNLIDATIVYNGSSMTSDQMDITTELSDPNDTDVTVNMTLTFTNNVQIGVTVIVHGWDETGTGGGTVG